MKQRRPLFILLLLLIGWLTCPLTDFSLVPTTSVVLASAGEPLNQDEPNAAGMVTAGFAGRRHAVAASALNQLRFSSSALAQQFTPVASPAAALSPGWQFVQRAAAAPRAPNVGG